MEFYRSQKIFQTRNFFLFGIIILSSVINLLWRVRTIEILGHRGLPVLYKENTLQSLLAPFSFGADGIETDVRLTKDGVPVLIHDETLTNFCGAGVRVGDLTLAELKEYKSNGETIPTLEEFLKLAPKTDV